MSEARETPGVTPKYRVGETVRYCDRDGRFQTGVVRHIEAAWSGLGTGPVKPIIIYSLWHPTYRNHRFYTGEVNILYVTQGDTK